MPFNLVLVLSALYLYAMAHLGLFAVKPSRSCCSRLFTLMTTPSVSRGSSWRFSSHSLMYSMTSLIDSHFLYVGDTLNPHDSSLPIASACVLIPVTPSML